MKNIDVKFIAATIVKNVEIVKAQMIQNLSLTWPDINEIFVSNFEEN